MNNEEMIEAAYANAPGAAPLSRLDDYEMADGYPDVRGWTVTTADGRTVGEVKELLCDTGALEVRYLVVDRDGAGTGELRVPVEQMRLDEDSRRVLVDASVMGASAQLADTGMHTAASVGAATAMTGNEERITRSEEELSVGTRKVAAGQLGIRKRVVTEHVSQPVTTQREEVTIERRPVTGDRTAAGIGQGEAEIHVPVTQEEVVVEKRPVVKEELVVRTKEVTEHQQVEADVRRERIDIDRQGETLRGSAADLDRTRDDRPRGT